MTAEQITICGCGPGAPELLTGAVRDAAAQAEVLAGSRRLLELFPGSAAERIVVGADIAQALEAIAQAHGKRIVVLVSGDPGLCSLAQPVIRRFGLERCRVIPGISSVQVAFARLGLDWTGAQVLSTHSGLPEVSAAELRRHEKIAVLGGRREFPVWIAERLEELGGEYRGFLCENLTLADEAVREVPAVEWRRLSPASLALAVIVKRTALP